MRSFSNKVLLGTVASVLALGGGTVAAVAASAPSTPGATTIADPSTTSTGPLPGESGPETAPSTTTPNAIVAKRFTHGSAATSKSVLAQSPELSSSKQGSLNAQFGLDPSQATATTIGKRAISLVPGSTGTCVGTTGAEGAIFSCGNVSQTLAGQVASAQLCVPGLTANDTVLTGLVPDEASAVRICPASRIWHKLACLNWGAEGG